VRLDGQQSEQRTGKDRLPLQQRERAANQARREKSILADDKIRQHGGKRRGEQITDAVADDGADRAR